MSEIPNKKWKKKNKKKKKKKMKQTNKQKKKKKKTKSPLNYSIIYTVEAIYKQKHDRNTPELSM
jgi:hypothetical protein